MSQFHAQQEQVVKTESDIINDIRVQLKENGDGVAMLLGSGISAASGIPMGQDFTDYLGFTVYKVINDKEGKPWDIRTQGWPKSPTRSDVEDARAFLKDAFTEICKRYKVEIAWDEKDKTMVVGLSRPPEDDSQETVPIDELNWNLTAPLIPQILCGDAAYPTEVRRKALYTNIFRKDAFQGWVAPTSYSANSREYVTEIAIRSLHDWRATLEFLSSVILRRGQAALGDLDPSVIDSFNAHITRNKRPNLSHTMIAHLLRPLRARFILTTNFDSLLEESFTQLSEPLQVLDVSTSGRLPSYRAVRAQDCLVKMHGGLTETRADFSLDEQPTLKDRDTFAAYFCGEPIHPSGNAPQQHRLIGLQHLLVIGYSGRDQRTISLIKHTLDAHTQFQVYWLCHSYSDVSRVRTLFETSYQQRVHIFTSSRPDLFLFELYQQITYSLPGGGFSFEYAPNIPPRRSESNATISYSKPKDEPRQKKFLQANIDKFCAAVSNPEIWTNPLTIDSSSGVMRFVLDRWDELERLRYMSLWFEMEEHHSPAALAFSIIQTMALKMGRYQLEHVSFFPPNLMQDSSPNFTDKNVLAHFAEVIRYLGITPHRCVIFLYGRNGAGGCAGFSPKHWSTPDYQTLKSVINLMLITGFRVVYCPYSGDRKSHDEETCTMVQRLVEQTRQKRRPRSKQSSTLAFKDKSGFEEVSQSTSPEPFNIPIDPSYPKRPLNGIKSTSKAHDADICLEPTAQTMHLTLGEVLGINYQPARDRPIAWLDLKDGINGMHGDVDTVEEKLQKLQFLYAITLFRQARHVTALCSEAVFRCPSRFNIDGEDNDEVRFRQASKWIEDLQERGYLLQKPGGFNWCYRDCRLAVRLIVELQGVDRLGPKRRFDFLGQMRARTHFWIADWYQKAFASTGHCTPLIESLFHRFEAIRYAPFAKLASKDLNKATDFQEVTRYRFEIAHDSMVEIIKLLQLGRSTFKFWLTGSPCWTYFDDSVVAALGELIEKNERAFGDDIPRKELLRLLNEVNSEFRSLRHSLLAEGGVPKGKVLKHLTGPKVELETRILGADYINKAPALSDSEWRSDFVNFFGSYKYLNGIYDKDPNSLFSIIDEYHRLSLQEGRGAAVDHLRRKLPKWRFALLDKTLAKKPLEQETLFVAVWSISELAYFYARRAKLVAHANKVRVPWNRSVHVPTAETEKVLQHWAIVSALCWLGIDLCNGLSPAFSRFEVSTRVKCSTLYGLALGYLSRFSEGHRRLNEGHALLSRSHSGLRGTEFAALHLRRAELFLCQAEDQVFSRENAPQPRSRVFSLFFAHLDDAWVSLERAERSLSGNSHSSLWWGRLYALKLRTFSLYRLVPDGLAKEMAEEGRLPIPLRVRVEVDSYLGDIARKALLVYSRDYYRTLRLARYFFRLPKALRALNISYDFNEVGDLLMNAVNSFPVDTHGLVQNFRQKVLDEIENAKNLDFALNWKSSSN